MPTYEYKREDGTTFEITQKMSDEPLKTCPTTGQPVKRMISGGSGVVYKGSGYYITDYKNGGRKKENKNGSATDKQAESTSKDSKSSTNSAND